jgi:hypothetical protein
VEHGGTSFGRWRGVVRCRASLVPRVATDQTSFNEMDKRCVDQVLSRRISVVQFDL